jgi:hypothetical protein
MFAVLANAQSTNDTGLIEGIVVNASQENRPLAEAEVALRVRIDGDFTVVERSVCDSEGRFRFESLPVDPDLLYLPGANRDGVHYPGRRIELTSRRPNAYLTLAVRDGVAGPSPLVVRKHEVMIRGEPGVIHVVEAMLVDNPGQTTYIGQAGEDETPVTLTLGIPMDFERLTFEEEFLGRRFAVSDGRVVTSIPWTPGPRWLRYTYSIPNENASRVLRRKLDLPSERVRIRVFHNRPGEVASNLPAPTDGSPGEVVFQSAGERLPAGYEIQVRLGRLPLPWMVYARWSALALLLGLVAVALVVIRRVAVDGHDPSREHRMNSPAPWSTNALATRLPTSKASSKVPLAVASTDSDPSGRSARPVK